jgi:hypothetical protein
VMKVLAWTVPVATTATPQRVRRKLPHHCPSECSAAATAYTHSIIALATCFIFEVFEGSINMPYVIRSATYTRGLEVASPRPALSSTWFRVRGGGVRAVGGRPFTLPHRKQTAVFKGVVCTQSPYVIPCVNIMVLYALQSCHSRKLRWPSPHCDPCGEFKHAA